MRKTNSPIKQTAFMSIEDASLAVDFHEDGSFNVRRMTDEDLGTIAEATLLKGEDIPLVKEIEQACQEAKKELIDSLKKELKTAVLASLGFEKDSWHGWRVDHCNGRMGLVAELIKNDVRQMITSVPDLASLSMPQKEIDEIKQALLSEMKENIKRELRDRARRTAADAASTASRHRSRRDLGRSKTVPFPQSRELALITRIQGANDGSD